jgi:hypothetical protein
LNDPHRVSKTFFETMARQIGGRGRIEDRDHVNDPMFHALKRRDLIGAYSRTACILPDQAARKIEANA